MSGDLIAFIDARLDEDERLAAGAIADLKADMITWDSLMQGGWKSLGLVADDELFDYLDSCNPERALREVEAKRLIVVHHDGPCCVPGYGLGGEQPCLTLRYLAAAWCRHPDYRQEWKP